MIFVVFEIVCVSVYVCECHVSWITMDPLSCVGKSVT